MRGICGLSVIPLRAEASEKSEQVNQVLFGETFFVIEEKKDWLLIRLDHDDYEGWLSRSQFLPLEEKDTDLKAETGSLPVVGDLIEIVSQKDGDNFFPIFLGSFLPYYQQENPSITLGTTTFLYNGPSLQKELKREQLLEMAFHYYHAPYQWGGRSPFGIDCSGLVQMVYRLAGYSLPRDASQQAKLGETLSFIEEAEPGDLAFFDNEEGAITHVGILMADNYIIHASGFVKVDRLDQSGIFSREKGRHTHRLRVLKKILATSSK